MSKSSASLLQPSGEERIQSILSQMTLDEKVGQLNQIYPGETFDPELLRLGKIGSVLNASGALTGQGLSSSTGAEGLNAPAANGAPIPFKNTPALRAGCDPWLPYGLSHSPGASRRLEPGTGRIRLQPRPLVKRPPTG